MSTRPALVQHAAVAVVGELVQAQVGHERPGRRRPPPRTRRSATLRIPSGSSAPDPTASLSTGTPKTIIPPIPASTHAPRAWHERVRACAGRRRACWMIRGVLVRPSRTNTGRTRSRGVQPGLRDQGPAWPGSGAAAAGARRRHVLGPASRRRPGCRWGAARPRRPRPPRAPDPGRGRRARRPGRRTTATAPSRRPAGRPPRRSWPLPGRCTATTVEGCGLPAMPTRLRTVELEVNTTASYWPDLIASRTEAAGGAARTVR